MNVRRAVIVAVAVIVVLAAALVYVRAENEKYHVDSEPSEVGLTVGTQLSEDGFPSESSRLWVYGNADEDDDIDEDDMRYLLGVLSGENPETVLSDANCDGTVDEDDLVYIQRIIESDRMEVFYVDNYYRVASVSWPVESIAIGYCSGAYVADLTGLIDKVVLIDDTIKNYWNEISPRFSQVGSFGATETPNYETMVAAGVDVYVVGYCDANADEISPSRLNPVGIDVMFVSTADNSGVDIPNENIDRSIMMFAFLLQGDMGKTHEYLDWHDGLLELMVDVVSSTASTIRIGGEVLPLGPVKERFRQLDSSHIEYVIDSLKQTTTKINNIRAYLLTVLYNAPVTIGPYYSAAVRHDFG